VLLVLTFALVLVGPKGLVVTPVHGHGGITLSGYTPIPPTIDGVIGLSEWSNAAQTAFTIAGTNGVLYVMNDATNLYIAAEIDDNDFNANDELLIYFDNDHDANAYDGDDALKVTGATAFIDGYVPDGGFFADTSGSGSNNGAASSTASGGKNKFEMQHPLDSTDNLRDFSIGTGSTVGFAVLYQDAGAFLGFWPSSVESTWNNIEIIAEPARPAMSAFATGGPPTIDGIVSPGEWAAADSTTFTLEATYMTTLYMMNDATDLYIAITVTDATLSSDDQWVIAFDNNNDGVAFGLGDDHLVTRGDSPFSDHFWTNDAVNPLRLDTDVGGTSDGAGVNAASGGVNSFELRHPLNDADDIHDFSLVVGAMIGVRVSYRDAGVLKGYYPQPAPSGWLQYTVAAGVISTSLAIGFVPPTVDIGTIPAGTATITAALTPNVAGKTVVLYYSKGSAIGPWTLISSGPTNGAGQLSFVWTPPETGTYFFRADFAGDATHGASTTTSDPASLVVIPEFPAAILPLLIVLTLGSLNVLTRKVNGRRR
jgi:hypothetical protein